MTIGNGKPTATPASTTPAAATPVAVAGGVGAMAVCCTLTLLIAAGVLGSLSGALIGGIAVGAGIAIAATVWLLVIWLRRLLPSRHQRRRSIASQSQAGRTGPVRQRRRQ